MKNYQYYCIKCVSCGFLTSKTYARTHAGQCKYCATGTQRDLSNHPLLCPDCMVNLRTPYERSMGRKCSSCVREFDRATGYSEVRD